MYNFINFHDFVLPTFQFGKDFESIHNLIVNKCKKKGAVLPITVKNKEQVRHFYYRTWHKISKLIQPVEGNDKLSELLLSNLSNDNTF